MKLREHEKLPEIISLIRSIDKDNVIVAIDGRCGAGKTTLASNLKRHLNCQIIHMDDFFLRPEQRTEERMNTPGENIDYERFLSDVLMPYIYYGEAEYRPYICSCRKLGENIKLNRTKIVVIEGSYSMHPRLREFYDLKIFMDIDPETQINRIIERNGPEAAKVFQTRWIPLEEMYFASCNVIGQCDVIFKNIRTETEV